jgi:hypothetical protein
VRLYTNILFLKLLKLSTFKDQLNEIRKISMANLICKDFDIDSIQPNVFLKASASIS